MLIQFSNTSNVRYKCIDISAACIKLKLKIEFVENCVSALLVVLNMLKLSH